MLTSYQRQAAITREVAQMVRDHLFRTVFRRAPAERIQEVLRAAKCHKTPDFMRHGTEFTFLDLLDLLDGAGVDLGLSIRTRDGQETTFWPGRNFGPTGSLDGTPHEALKATRDHDNFAHAHNRGAYRHSAAHHASPAPPSNNALRVVGNIVAPSSAVDDAVAEVEAEFRLRRPSLFAQRAALRQARAAGETPVTIRDLSVGERAEAEVDKRLAARAQLQPPRPMGVLSDEPGENAAAREWKGKRQRQELNEETLRENARRRAERANTRRAELRMANERRARLGIPAIRPVDEQED